MTLDALTASLQGLAEELEKLASGSDLVAQRCKSVGDQSNSRYADGAKDAWQEAARAIRRRLES